MMILSYESLLAQLVSTMEDWRSTPGRMKIFPKRLGEAIQKIDEKKFQYFELVIDLDSISTFIARESLLSVIDKDISKAVTESYRAYYISYLANRFHEVDALQKGVPYLGYSRSYYTLLLTFCYAICCDDQVEARWLAGYIINLNRNRGVDLDYSQIYDVEFSDMAFINFVHYLVKLFVGSEQSKAFELLEQEGPYASLVAAKDDVELSRALALAADFHVQRVNMEQDEDWPYEGVFEHYNYCMTPYELLAFVKLKNKGIVLDEVDHSMFRSDFIKIVPSVKNVADDKLIASARSLLEAS